MIKIVIVDYGIGNLHSVHKAFKRIGVEAIISSDKNIICEADKLVLPGVGNFERGMSQLKNLELIAILESKVIEKGTPILGICLGMQLFTKFSEEGDCDGLGWIDAKTVRFNFSNKTEKINVPHIGWNNLHSLKPSSILTGVEKSDSFYFVHSYYVSCNDNENILAFTNYGIDFVSVIKKENIIGMQFHPEKSHKKGLQILKNFIKF